MGKNKEREKKKKKKKKEKRKTIKGNLSSPLSYLDLWGGLPRCINQTVSDTPQERVKREIGIHCPSPNGMGKNKEREKKKKKKKKEKRKTIKGKVED
jgi:hypothetical protein